MWLQESFAPSFFGFSCACHSDSFCIEQQTRLWKTCEDYKLQKQEWKQHLEASAIPTKGKPRSLCAFRSTSASPEPCSKCLTSWHQIRKCLRHCLRAHRFCLRAYLVLRGVYAGLRAPQFCLRHTLTRDPLLNMNRTWLTYPQQTAFPIFPGWPTRIAVGWIQGRSDLKQITISLPGPPGHQNTTVTVARPFRNGALHRLIWPCSSCRKLHILVS